jgi:hypothetical protein
LPKKIRQFIEEKSFFEFFFSSRHFAFISFVNDTTALDVLRQHAIVPITFQNRPIILAPAYKKTNPSSISMIVFSIVENIRSMLPKKKCSLSIGRI